MAISISDPIGKGFSRAKLVCFQPFNIGKWFVLGFCAFLASLGEGGGGGNYNFPTGGKRAPVPAPMPMPTPRGGPVGVPSPSPSGGDFKEAWHWINSNIGAAILIGLLIVIVVIAISLVIIWLNSRGQFMFIDGIARNVAEVVAPWKRFRPLGNSLFAFRAALAAIGMSLTFVVGGIGLLVAWGDIRSETFGGGAVAALLIGLLILVPAWILFGLINWATTTFVAPIMYVSGMTVVPAWQEFRENVMRGHIGSLLLFLLMQILLGIGVAFAAGLAGCLTCCVGFLPYLHNVLTLPLAVFMRSYSMYFLQQFDPRYTMMVEPPPMAMGFPVTGVGPGAYGQQPYPPYQQPPYQPPPPPPGGDLPR